MEKEIILFVSEKDLNFSLVISTNNQTKEVYFIEGKEQFINFLRCEYEDCKIVVYNCKEAINTVMIANECNIPVISISDMMIQNYYTDLLPLDLINAENAAKYLGICEPAESDAVLIFQMYTRVRADEHKKNKFFDSKIRTHKKI